MSWSRTNDQQVIQTSLNFLWVDHDSENSQGKADSRTMQSFLAKKHHRLRRRTQLEQLRASMKAFPPAAWLPASKSTVDTSLENESNDRRDFTMRIVPIDQIGSRIQHPITTRVDDILPALSRHSKHSMDFYFDYFRAQASRRWYPIGQNEMLNSTLRQSFHYPRLLEVIMSMSAYDYAMTRKAQNISSEVVRDSLHDAFYIRSHIIRSIQFLLARLGEIYTESAVIVIGHLFVTEALERNLEAVDAHIEALQKIVHALGGLEKLGTWPLAIIYACDPIRGLFKVSSPAFNIPREWETRVFEAIADRARPTRQSYPALGTRFFNSSWSQAIHPRLGIIIRSVQDMLAIYEDTLRLKIDLQVADHNCALLLINRLQSLPHAHTLSSFSDAIRLAIWIYFLTRVWEFQASAESLLQTLLGRLEENLEFFKGSASDLFFWILYNGAFSSAGFQCHAWFVARLKNLAQEVSLFEWEEVTSVLEGFFFVDRFATDPAKAFWYRVILERTTNYVKLD